MRRPDLVDVWLFRFVDDAPQILMLHRAAHRVLPGLWQGVSGLVEPDETITDAALREVREETGLEASAIKGFFHLDYVAEFLWEPSDALMTGVYFAIRTDPAWDPVLSHEHDSYEWLPLDGALRRSVWPGYREALIRLRDNVLDPERAPWFELSLEGERVRT
jgi:8-oxo-dGTP pyrophosphatase MutT (NUDIX family)